MPGTEISFDNSVWLVRRTSVMRPYPCACEAWRASRGGCWTRCDCAGRLDLHNVPPYCCAHYNTPAVVTMKSWRS